MGVSLARIGFEFCVMPKICYRKNNVHVTFFLIRVRTKSRNVTGRSCNQLDYGLGSLPFLILTPLEESLLSPILHFNRIFKKQLNGWCFFLVPERFLVPQLLSDLFKKGLLTCKN